MPTVPVGLNAKYAKYVLEHIKAIWLVGTMRPRLPLGPRCFVLKNKEDCTYSWSNRNELTVAQRLQRRRVGEGLG